MSNKIKENSNTTFVKVKLKVFKIKDFMVLIQIQHLLKLNWRKQNNGSRKRIIQIQHLLKLNINNRCVVYAPQ